MSAGRSLLTLLMLAAGLSPVSANALPPTSLSDIIGRFYALEVDQARERVYVSGGAAEEEVVVLDFHGSVVDVFDGLAGPTGLELVGDTLYVSETNADRIATIPVGSTGDPGAIPLVDVTSPRDLAWAGGRLWLAHNCQVSAADGMASVNVTTGVATVYSGPEDPTECPKFATSAAMPDMLAMGLSRGTDRELRVYDVSTGSPDLTVSEDEGIPTIRDLFMRPDGASLFVSANSDVWEYATSSLQLLRRYESSPTVHGGEAIEVGGEVHIGASIDGSLGTGMFVFRSGVTPPAAGTPVTLRNLEHMANAGFAFAPDGSSALIVTTEVGSTLMVRVHVIEEPLLDSATITVEEPGGQVPPGGPLHIRGAVSLFSGADPSPMPLQLIRGGPGGEMVVDTGFPDPGGDFDLVDEPPEGTFRYRVEHPGTGDYRELVSLEYEVDVARLQGSLTLDAPRNVSYPRRITVNVTFGRVFDAGSQDHWPIRNPVVDVLIRPKGQGWRLLGRVPLDGQGLGSASMRLKRNSQLKAVFPGDTAYFPMESNTKSVQVFVKVVTRLKGSIGKRGRYRLFRVGSPVIYVVGVQPKHKGKKVQVRVRWESPSGLVVIGRRKFRLGKGSVVAVAIGLPRGKYQLEARFLSDGDHQGSLSKRSRVRVV